MVARRSLSDLPDDAIDEILSRLPIKDAVRTSTLSSYWRHRWKSIPDLDFSDLSSNEISKVLDLHSGPIRLFKAKQPRLSDDDFDWDKFCEFIDNIDDWLATLSVRATSTLRTLSINFYDFLDVDPFACDFPNLTHLEFCCTIPIVQPQFCGFLALRSLHLIGFACTCLEESLGISRLISACPLLETLKTTNVDGLLYLEINVAPNLRRLQMSCSELHEISVTSAPILELASIRNCYCNCSCCDSPENYCDCCSAYYHVDDDGGGGSENCKLMKVFQGMASIKKLELDDLILTFVGRGHIPERIPMNFNHLRVMSLNADFGNMRVALVTLCLLRSAPNLQNLTIQGGIYLNKVLETGNDFWEAQEHIDLFDKLGTLTVTQLREEDDLGFILFLLAKARVLKTITISFKQGVKEKESIMTKLSEFPRVSDQAQILWT